MLVDFVPHIFLLFAIAASPYTAVAWMSPTTRFSTVTRPVAANSRWNLAKEEAEGETEPLIIENDTPEVQWGVSYIGGDPCGSKYNSDPFDKQPSDKPGLPDDMKARIAALAKKKLQEQQEQEASNND